MCSQNGHYISEHIESEFSHSLTTKETFVHTHSKRIIVGKTDVRIKSESTLLM
jgi:hypothetical protein